MESQEMLIQMIRESAKITAYAVEWFNEKFNPTAEEIEKAKRSARHTSELIERLAEMKKG